MKITEINQYLHTLFDNMINIEKENSKDKLRKICLSHGINPKSYYNIKKLRKIMKNRYKFLIKEFKKDWNV